MLSIKFYILYIVLLTTIAEIRSLVEVSTAEDGILRFTETIIRNTMNHIFTDLNIRGVKWQHNLKQFFTIHNYFMSITLTDCDNLKKIVELSRVNNIDNNTLHLIAKINEVLDKSDKSSESNTNDEYVEKYIKIFIGKLKHLKDQYLSHGGDVIDEKKLNYLINNKAINVTRNKKNETNIDENFYNDDNNEFWKPNGRRLFRGFRTRIKHFPFMASIQFFRKFQCAGSIIKNDLVITSASCLQLSWNNRFFRENPPFVTVQIGSDYYEHGGENIGVQEIYFYPTYDPKTLNNNLAIIRLSRRINFHKKSRRVRKIDINRNPSKWIPNKRFDLVTVVGWGARDSSNIIYNVLNNKLSYAELDYYPLYECRKHYSRAFVTRRNFCAGFFSKGGGACNRDAGGPAIVNGMLLGIISFGSPICGLPDSPTVFTKLGFYGDWIDEILEKEVPYTYKRTTPLVPRPFNILEKSMTKKFKMTPMVTTPELITIDNIAALRIPQQYGYDDFSSFSFDSKEPFENIKTVSKAITHQPLNISKKPKDISTQTIKVTAIIPVLESTNKGKTNSELDESEDNESNDAPIETGTESAERITVLGQLEENQDIKDNVNALVDNLDLDKLLNDMENNTTQTVRSEKSNVSKNVFNTINQSSVNYLSSSNEDEEGLNIPAESFHNLPLKISPETRGYDKVSESMLFEVVSKAIEKEIKLQVRERKKVSKGTFHRDFS